MNQNFNIIFHITTACNFDCSYCDVIKDKQFISEDMKQDVIKFIDNNSSSIESFKFFGGEPLLASKDIRDIVDKAQLGDKYCLVTNTSLLTDDIGEYFENNFERLFFSIDSENDFDFIKTQSFIQKYNLQKKVYFNLIISPRKETHGYENFMKLYRLGLKQFNILPVYVTQSWSSQNLKNLSAVLKQIIDKSREDTEIQLYGFGENQGYDTSLFNNVLFIDIDGKIYYSDVASTFSGQSIKQSLYIGDIQTLRLEDIKNIDFGQKNNIIDQWEQEIYKTVSGQKQLHEIMDYFSKYLGNAKG